jgi:hypothetical protein
MEGKVRGGREKSEHGVRSSDASGEGGWGCEQLLAGVSAGGRTEGRGGGVIGDAHTDRDSAGLQTGKRESRRSSGQRMARGQPDRGLSGSGAQ